MKHRFFYDTANLRLSPDSERSLARYHFQRTERFHRFLAPLLLLLIAALVKYGFGL